MSSREPTAEQIEAAARALAKHNGRAWDVMSLGGRAQYEAFAAAALEATAALSASPPETDGEAESLREYIGKRQDQFIKLDRSDVSPIIGARLDAYEDVLGWLDRRAAARPKADGERIETQTEALRRKVERSHANFRRSYEMYRDPKEHGYALALEWVLRTMDEIADDQGLTVRPQEGGKA